MNAQKAEAEVFQKLQIKKKAEAEVKVKVNQNKAKKNHKLNQSLKLQLKKYLIMLIKISLFKKAPKNQPPDNKLPNTLQNKNQNQ